MNIEVYDETAGDADPPEGDEPRPLDAPPSPEHVERLAAYVMDAMRVHPEAELSVRLVDREVIADLNSRWMGKDGPTDVLAFPMDELRPAVPGEEPEEGVLGDLVICPQVAADQAASVRTRGDAAYSCTAEVELLTTHGILHLLGHDHAEPDEHRVMFGLQAQLLEGWRAASPMPDSFDPLAPPDSFPPSPGETAPGATS